MGKKKIAKKFASVKRIISSQDDRMYLFPLYVENKINKNLKNNNVKEDNCFKNKPPMKFKLNKCISLYLSKSQITILYVLYP